MTKALQSISRGESPAPTRATIRIVAMIPPYVTVIAEMTAHPGKEEELKRHLLVLVERTRQEEGCIQYDLHVSRDDPRQFVFVENWATAGALDRHSKSAHMDAFRQVSAALRADPAVRTYTRIA
jgi:quinol monooxygenase YgiN